MSTRRTRPGAYEQDRRALGGWPTGPNGRRICRQCPNEVPQGRQTFCSKECVHEWQLRTNPNYVRIKVLARDNGICAECGVDTYAESVITHRRARGSGHLWQADHIIPVIEGGGECGLDNYRTLCIPCHRRVTAELRARMKQRRIEAKALPLVDEVQA
jgi:5-methylcytosine-specific restriction protein A